VTDIFPITFNYGDKAIALEMELDPSHRPDLVLGNAIAASGAPEPEVITAMFHIVRPGDRVVDGGANIGFFTLILSQLVGPDGGVVAYEPGSNNLPRLMTNVKLNDARNIKVVTNPLWGEEAEVTLYLATDSGWNSLRKADGAHDYDGTITCGSERMTSTCLNLDGVRFAKLDIEGAEEMVLRGSTISIHHCPYIITEMNEEALNRFNCSGERLRSFMWFKGYKTFLLHNDGALPTYLPPLVKIKSSRPNANVLFSTFDAVAEAWPEIKI